VSAEPARAGPDCLACRHYFVTHDARWPHGCRAFGLQSRLLPAIEVRASSGSECRAFAPRPGPGARRARDQAS
jgi:hypothetical protein